MHATRTLRLVIAMGVVGCGSTGKQAPGDGQGAGSDLASGDPGSGTKTLYAGVELSLSSIDGSTPLPSLVVAVAAGARGGAAVSGATIVLSATDGTTITPTEDAGTPGTYEADNLTWESSWHLQITSGSDQLEATIAAPGATTITSPTPNATVSAGSVTFAWTDVLDEHAQSVWVSPCCGDPIVDLTDSGSGSVLVAAPGGVFTLYRQDALPLDGGAAGSLATAVTSYGVLLTVQ